MSLPTSKGMYISWNEGNNQAFFDVTLSDEVESVLDVTDHPVETGADISDNARIRLKRFAFEAIVSDTPINEGVRQNGALGAVTQTQIQVPVPTREIPINPLGAAVELAAIGISAVFGGNAPTNLNALQWTKPFDAVTDMLYQLWQLQSDATILRLVTSKYSFQNVLLTNVKQVRTKEEGSGARYRLEFKQLIQVASKFTDSPLPAEPRGNEPANQGSKNTQQQTPAQMQSVTNYLLNKGVGAVKNLVSQ